MLPARSRSAAFLFAVLLVLSLFSGACTSAGSSAHRVFRWPDRHAWKTAARDAARDPATWVPAAGAAVVAAGGWDHKISRWAVRETPIFGSTDEASRWSNRLRGASDAGMLIAAMLPSEAGSTRLERLMVDELGAITANETTSVLKRVTKRVRPNGADDRSFPSGHATRSAATAGIAVRDLSRARLSRSTRIALDSSLYVLSGATAWARVEAGVHYPTDVLAGAALGNFIGRVVHDAWLGEHAPMVALVPEPHGDAVVVRFTW